MKICPKCNNELNEGDKFCDRCGTEISETLFCPDCGQQTSSESVFCQNYGADTTKKSVNETSEKPKTKRKAIKTAVISGIAVAFVIALLITVISLIFRGGKTNDYALYIKDEEIFFTDLKKKNEPWQLTNRLLDFNIDDMMKYGGNLLISRSTYISEDGKLIFFPEKYDEAGMDDGFHLYYKKVNKPDSEAVKIDSKIMTYSVNSSATTVTFFKDNGAKSGKAETIGDLYQYSIKKDSKEKIAGDISALVYVSEDAKTVYYIKNDSLYKQVEGKDKVKIASDINYVIKIYDSGEIYYLKREADEGTCFDYIEDDMKEADASVQEPKEPTRPSWYDYDTDEEYENAYADYEKAYAAYEKDRDAYKAKAERDELRRALKETSRTTDNDSLCFFDGKQETVITDNFYSVVNYVCATDKPVISYAVKEQSEREKIKISEISSIDDFYNESAIQTDDSFENFIAIKGTATALEHNNVNTVRINASGTVVYYIEEDYGDLCGDLYRASIQNGTLGKPELYDSDVFGNLYGGRTTFFINDDELVYFKDFQAETGDLYINKEKIDYDVHEDSLCVFPDKLIYFTDCSYDGEDEYGVGTLKIYQNGKSEKIADDVSYKVYSAYAHCTVTSDGKVLFLSDYSTTRKKGELYIWDKGKTKKLDDDVVCVLEHNLNDSTNLNGYYYGQ